MFCSGVLQSWYELCGWGGFCCLSFLGCVRGVFGSGVFVSGEEGVPEGCVLGDEWGRMMTDMYNGEVRSSF